VGTFTDFEGTVEYFFDVAPYDKQNSRFVFDKFVLRQYSEDGPIVVSTVDLITLPNPNIPGPPSTKLTQTGFWRFDGNHRDALVMQYDLNILNLDRFTIDSGTNYHEPEMRNNILQGICFAHQQFCKGKNQQYNDFNECVSFMTTKIPFGNFNEMDSDTVACRTLHAPLTAQRPDVHCPHIGPTGGMKCVDSPYKDYYEFKFPLPFMN